LAKDLPLSEPNAWLSTTKKREGQKRKHTNEKRWKRWCITRVKNSTTCFITTQEKENKKLIHESKITNNTDIYITRE
jgi:hypothetical protein